MSSKEGLCHLSVHTHISRPLILASWESLHLGAHSLQCLSFLKGHYRMNSLSENNRKQKLIFALFTFTPLFLSFLLPFVFFKFPLLVTAHSISLQNHYVYIAMLMITGWFALLGCSIVLPCFCRMAKRRPWSDDKLPFLMVIFTLVGLIYYLTRTLITFPNALSQLILPISMFPVVSITIGIYLTKNKLSCPKWLITLLCYINGLVIFFAPLLNGNSFETVYSLVALSFAYTIINKNPLKSTIFILISLCIIASSMLLKNYVREMKFHQILGIQKNTSLFTYDYDLWKSAQKKLNQVNLPSTGMMKYPHYAMDRVINRLDHLNEFAFVLMQTPSKIPFVYGKTYELITPQYMFIPRFLWHNKPIIALGQFYGYRYHFIGRKDKITYWAMTLPIEAWINFGWTSFILSAILIGLLLNFLWDFFAGDSIYIGNIILATTLVFNASHGESSTSMVIGLLIHSLIFYWVLDILIRHFFQAKE